MSKVYSFRLDKNNPREVLAKKVLIEWQNKGFSIRYTITQALLMLGGSIASIDENDELIQTINQVKYLLEKIDSEDTFISSLDSGKSDLEDSCIALVKRTDVILEDAINFAVNILASRPDDYEEWEKNNFLKIFRN